MSHGKTPAARLVCSPKSRNAPSVAASLLGAMRGARMTRKRTRRGRQIDGAADDGDHVKKKGIARATAGTASDGTMQRVFARPKADKENIGAPGAEAKDRVERIMRGEDFRASLNALAENRWNRKCKLLPNLKLTYPSDDESRQIAELARINYSSWFGQHIHSIILDAHLTHASFLTLSIPQVRKVLKRVASQVNQLERIISKLDVGTEMGGSEVYAGWLIEKELAFQQFEVGGKVLLPQYIDLLHGLSSAAQRGAQKPMHVPKGAGGNWAFDNFIEDLVMTARTGGGSWTNYKARDGIWTGTLLEALTILKEYVPRRGFFPNGVVGRSVEHIRKKLADHIQRGR
jgi:hypothetical protein